MIRANEADVTHSPTMSGQKSFQPILMSQIAWMSHPEVVSHRNESFQNHPTISHLGLPAQTRTADFGFWSVGSAEADCVRSVPNHLASVGMHQPSDVISKIVLQSLLDLRKLSHHVPRSTISSLHDRRKLSQLRDNSVQLCLHGSYQLRSSDVSRYTVQLVWNTQTNLTIVEIPQEQ